MLPIKIRTQPTDVTCGPTSLQAIYQYYGDNISLEQVIQEVTYLKSGGTLAVWLATHALARGYIAKIYTYNLRMFDPTWFNHAESSPQYLIEKLTAQKKAKDLIRVQNATEAYLHFLESGGQILFEDLTPSLLAKYFCKQVPILAGLSSTYLYNCSREVSPDDLTTLYDDVSGLPSGHFVVLSGYDEETNQIVVADPYPQNPAYLTKYYSVKVNRLINSIMLGVLTYDSNFLIIEKPE